MDGRAPCNFARPSRPYKSLAAQTSGTANQAATWETCSPPAARQAHGSQYSLLHLQSTVDARRHSVRFCRQPKPQSEPPSKASDQPVWTRLILPSRSCQDIYFTSCLRRHVVPCFHGKASGNHPRISSEPNPVEYLVNEGGGLSPTAGSH